MVASDTIGIVLVNREEMVKAENLHHYYRIPADTRDLNYAKYFSEGQSQVSMVEEYTSHNTYRLNLEETKNLLLTLDEVMEEIKLSK